MGHINVSLVLDKVSYLKDSERGDAVKVARAISALVNR